MPDKTNLWDIQGHIQIFTIKIQKEGSNMCITVVAIMVSQYVKMFHIKSKGFMATNEQGGSMLQQSIIATEIQGGSMSHQNFI